MKKVKNRKQPAQSQIADESFSLALTRPELVHLRDLLSIVLPPEGELTVSRALAECNGSHSDESLWSKIWNLCSNAGVQVGDGAPNFMVGPAAPQELNVFRFELEE